MNFLKKIFGDKEEGGAKEGGGGAESTFVCETCGQERKESQRKQHEREHEDASGKKNVCEFC